ncbi:MAG: plasmid recombination protein [Malacoplasma sp.]
MYDGKQVLRFVTNYKSKDLYNIGNEMTNRQGTGNYDKERTKFNVHCKDINSYNLYQEVKQKLESNNIEYLKKTKTNMLNGVTITSGPEFFRTLGMEFKETGRYYNRAKRRSTYIISRYKKR